MTYTANEMRYRERVASGRKSAEWKYRYEERLGILCGAADATLEQIALATAEADRYAALEQGVLL